MAGTESKRNQDWEIRKQETNGAGVGEGWGMVIGSGWHTVLVTEKEWKREQRMNILSIVLI